MVGVDGRCENRKSLGSIREYHRRDTTWRTITDEPDARTHVSAQSRVVSGRLSWPWGSSSSGISRVILIGESDGEPNDGHEPKAGRKPSLSLSVGRPRPSATSSRGLLCACALRGCVERFCLCSAYRCWVRVLPPTPRSPQNTALLYHNAAHLPSRLDTLPGGGCDRLLISEQAYSGPCSSRTLEADPSTQGATLIRIPGCGRVAGVSATLAFARKI